MIQIVNVIIDQDYGLENCHRTIEEEVTWLPFQKEKIFAFKYCNLSTTDPFRFFLSVQM